MWTRIMTSVMLVGLWACAYAYPTLTGPTGQAVIPTAEIAPLEFSAAADILHLPCGSAFPLRAVFQAGELIELGIMRENYTDDARLDNTWGANIKASAFTFVGGKVALGMQIRHEEYLRDAPRPPQGRASTTPPQYHPPQPTPPQQAYELDYAQGYAAWTATFPAYDCYIPFITTTLGVNYTRVFFPCSVRDEAVRYFAGASMNLLRDFDILVDYQSAKREVGDEAATGALTLRCTFQPGLVGQVGVTNAFGLRGLTDHRTFAGLSIAFSATCDDDDYPQQPPYWEHD